MKAVICTALGGPDNLEVLDVADPVPTPGEIVIAVKAAALNFFDNLLIRGKYQYRPEPPFSPSAEAAGIVEAAGQGVSGFKPGDRVMAYAIYGCAREKVAVPAHKAVHLPEDLAFPLAAGLTVTYGTTLHALKDRANLQPGETLAILGASGGVGQAAIEIGKVMGARVIACASSDDKLSFCREMGADETVNYASEDLKTRLKDLTGGKGVDVVYDAVGGAHSEAALRATAWNGRFLVIGFAAGEIPKIPLNLVLLKGCQVVCVFWGDHTEREPDRHNANMAQLVDWCAQGKIRPHIHKIYSFEETPQALVAIANREVKGKAIIVP
jgi:NADPH2:quinone reductase